MFRENFEGDYRRRPEQSLVGASKRDGRFELLQKAHEERRRRELKRLHHKHATTIQSTFRSFLVRKNIKQNCRNEFVTRINGLQGKNLDDTASSTLMRQMLIFYNPEVDEPCLKWMTKYFLQNHEQIFALWAHDQKWHWYILKLFEMNLNLKIPGNPKEDVIDVLKFFDVFTDKAVVEEIVGEEKAQIYLEKLFSFVIEKKYLKTMAKLINYYAMRKHCTRSSISGEELLPLFTRPWTIFQSAQLAYKESVNKSLYIEILCVKEFINASVNLIIPILNSLMEFSFPTFLCTLHGLIENLPSTSEGLHSFLLLDMNFTAVPKTLLVEYLEVLAILSANIVKLPTPRDDSDSEMNDDEMTIECKKTSPTDMEFCSLERSVDLLNKLKRVTEIISAVEHNLCPPVLRPLSVLLHHMLMSRKYAVSYYKLLILMSGHSSLIKSFWTCIINEEYVEILINEQAWKRPVLDCLIENGGFNFSDFEKRKMVPLITTFAALFKSFLRTLPDESFHLIDQDCDEFDQIMPFTIDEILTISAKLRNFCLSMIKTSFTYNSFGGTGTYVGYVGLAEPPSPFTRPVWRRLFEEIAFLLKHIYIRDVRRPFAPYDHWVCNKITLSSHFNPNRKYFIGDRFDRFRPYLNVPFHRPEDREEGLEALSIFDVRALTTLREIPFSISFIERVGVFQNLLLAEKREHQNPSVHFHHTRSLFVNVRRNYLYEDAYENLCIDKAPQLRIAIRIHFINSLGMEEVGVDGGGVFREFISELLKSAFDPNRGFFLLNNDNQIYPNPNVAFLHADYLRHYFFIGRMLGKAIFEGLLVDLPFADFFLAKIIGSNVDVNLNNMASLDPDLYRNLKYLRGFKGNIEDLGLDFSITVDHYGKTEVVELTPKGTEMGVNSSNKIEYIHLVADFKMNKQIQAQCNAFKQGLSNVVPLEWLSIFNTKELQIMISGQESPVDTTDLQLNATYTGGYSPDHPNIQMFWRVVDSFDNKQRSDLLKFVTSCPRPPLLGFKELDPPFCIQFIEGTGDRLPTASTCMNLLKLPVFPNENVLKEKLLYAIESGSGFELS